MFGDSAPKKESPLSREIREERFQCLGWRLDLNHHQLRSKTAQSNCVLRFQILFIPSSGCYIIQKAVMVLLNYNHVTMITCVNYTEGNIFYAREV